VFQSSSSHDARSSSSALVFPPSSSATVFALVQIAQTPPSPRSIQLGHIRVYGKKTLEGTAAFALVSLVFFWLYMSNFYQVSTSALLQIGTVGAISGAFSSSSLCASSLVFFLHVLFALLFHI